MTGEKMFDVNQVRRSFPALSQSYAGKSAIFADAPGGTQVPSIVADSMKEYMLTGVSNLGGFYPTSLKTIDVMQAARHGVKLLINAEDESEISFGQNMTSITFSISQAIAKTWQKGDVIVVSELDHEANISPWVDAANRAGATVKYIPFNQETCMLDLDTLAEYLQQGGVKFLAITLASNICGSITDIQKVMAYAKSYNVQVYVDAVHFIAHHIVDVKEIGCDWLAFSGYKICGPHIGVLYSNAKTTNTITPNKILPAPQTRPFCYETGTQNFEAMVGLTRAIIHKASLSSTKDASLDRSSIIQSMLMIKTHESRLKKRLLDKLSMLERVNIHGVKDQAEIDRRTPTFALSIPDKSAHEVAKSLANRGVFAGSGNFYVPKFVQRMALEYQGGVVRLGFAYYNTEDEIDQVVSHLSELTSKKALSAKL